MRSSLAALLVAALSLSPVFGQDSFESQVQGAFNAFKSDRAQTRLAPQPAPAQSRVLVDAPLEAVIARSQPSVATIIVPQYQRKGGLLSSLLGRDMALPTGMVSQGTGWVARVTGWDMLLVTNNHVVSNREVGGKVYVQFDDHVNLEATVVGKNVKKDLALIDVSTAREPRPALPLGDSSTLRQGDRVIALGSPLGLRQSATAGIFSAVGLDQRYYPGGYLQTDLSINHGNSGGPLFDIDGTVVGVNFAIPGEGTGLGLAIPVEFVKQALDQLDRFHALVNAGLGAKFAGSNWLDTRLSASQPGDGAWIGAVNPGSPAEAAGLRRGDRLVAVDGAALPASSFDAVAAVTRAVALKSPGDSMQVTVERAGERHDLSITLDKADE